MKKSLLFSLVIAAALPAAASASTVIQQANQNIQQPIADSAPASEHVKAGVDVANTLGHSAAMTETTFALMQNTQHKTRLPVTDHNLASPEQPTDW
ncbi:MAG: hypothetical protein L0J54_05130 [Halomonas sp.]|nr:hypothetical protein [Halomonas sp.]MDN6297395.1 hypothetical protein [Halomonas sp.]MDN6314672.1 hypothetical protein [Halomonas sp.]MDN6337048.1 hypothetical protein [Halomonas sp.]